MTMFQGTWCLQILSLSKVLLITHSLPFNIPFGRLLGYRVSLLSLLLLFHPLVIFQKFVDISNVISSSVYTFFVFKFSFQWRDLGRSGNRHVCSCKLPCLTRLAFINIKSKPRKKLFYQQTLFKRKVFRIYKVQVFILNHNLI